VYALWDGGTHYVFDPLIFHNNHSILITKQNSFGFGFIGGICAISLDKKCLFLVMKKMPHLAKSWIMVGFWGSVQGRGLQVMDIILQIIKDYFIPGSATFLLIGLALGVILLYAKERARRWGRIWLTVLAVGYWIISTPLGAKALEAGLSIGYKPIEASEGFENVDAIVILGGGSINLKSRGKIITLLITESALRTMEGIRVYEMLDDPLIIVSGGSNPFLGGGRPESELMAEMLVDSDIPEDRILLETLSQSTRDQAKKLKPLLESHEIDRFVLITSPIHMRRSMAVFEDEGLNPIPSPSSMISEMFSDGGIGIFPSWVALDASQGAFREYMALTYYWLRGWL
jgi:uncharacterized SAM-binding protein YcdF (DUF218 family)